MRQTLFLLSSSAVFGMHYLEHALDGLKTFLGDERQVLFVPYALANYDGHTARIQAALLPLGAVVKGVHTFSDPRQAMREARVLYVGGGNSFRLLKTFQINPHYVDPDPNSTHQGETRADRIAEFLEENDVAVLGMREGSWLHRSGPTLSLEGVAGARLFMRNEEPQEIAPGTDLSWLLEASAHFDQRI